MTDNRKRDMDFSRRRLLTILGVTASGLILPVATHGAAAPVFAAVADRYAETARLLRSTLDVFPSAYWDDDRLKREAFRKECKRSGYADRLQETLNIKADAALSFILDNFKGSVDIELIRRVLQGQVTIEIRSSNYSEADLASFSDSLLPVVVIFNLLNRCEAPITLKGSPSFARFVDRYGETILAA